MTFRVTDPATACARIDFSSTRHRAVARDAAGAGRRAAPETAQQQARPDRRSPLASVLADGVGQIRDRILAGLTGDPRLAETGIAVIGARWSRSGRSRTWRRRCRPRPGSSAAGGRPGHLRAAGAGRRARAGHRRERAAEPDRAGPPRGAARRPARTNARRQAEENAAASGIEAGAQAAREQRLAEARAEGTRALGEARAAGEAARVAAYRDLAPASLLGLAAKDLAGSLPQIGSLVLTPDLLAPLLARLGAGQAPGPGSAMTAASHDPPPAGRARAPPHRVPRAPGPARHPGSGCLLPVLPGPRHRGRDRPRPGRAGRDHHCHVRHSRGLAARPDRAGRPAPVPLRARRHRHRRRARTAWSPTWPSTSTGRSSWASTRSRPATRASSSRTPPGPRLTSSPPRPAPGPASGPSRSAWSRR